MRDRPLDPDWADETVATLTELVASGDETGLAERVVGLVGDRRSPIRTQQG